MKIGILFPAVCLALVTSPVAAQSANPFKPGNSGGMTPEQVRKAVAAEMAAQKNAAPGNPADVAAIPSQPGAPAGSPVGMVSPGMTLPVAAPVIVDPVADLFADGGTFVGCVNKTPVFRDRVGRRAYFTSKELKDSHEARRFARC